ncbi:MAG: zinc dependent phospholipase C family protein [Ktedonobacteraceae bacterium]
MPAFLTHWRVLIETARQNQDAGQELGSLLLDASALRRRAHGWVAPAQTTATGAIWNTGPLPDVDFGFPGSDISAMAFLGALAPDISLYQKLHLKDAMSGERLRARLEHQQATVGRMHWSELLHTQRSGDILIAFLELIAEIPSPALRSQALAFTMGYLSHIAADIALHPCINALAATYRQSDIPHAFQRIGPHFYVELCLDEYIASTYFNSTGARAGWTGQPWAQYIAPAARNFTRRPTFSAPILAQLTQAAEITYHLDETQATAFRVDHLAGLQQLQRYLAGHDISRLLTLYALRKNRVREQIIATIAAGEGEPGTITFEQAIGYAIRLSTRFCRNAINFYAALRNPNVSAGERRDKRAILCADLRNWNLDTGYAFDVTFDEEVTLHVLHNWMHFAELWEQKASTSTPPTP